MTRARPMLALFGIPLAVAAAGSVQAAGDFMFGALGAAQSAAARKRVPLASSLEEFQDYNRAYALTGGGETEIAADRFAAAYPHSELTVYLYSKAMHEYRKENNSARALAMAEKVLRLDADDPAALVLSATVLADRMSESDLDREYAAERIRRRCKHALEIVDTAFAASANATAEQIAADKATLRTMAYSALGIMELKIGDFAGAEKDLHVAAEGSRTRPDARILYHLSLAEDRLQKYTDALANVNRAMLAAGNDGNVRKAAAEERRRLEDLARGASVQH